MPQIEESALLLGANPRLAGILSGPGASGNTSIETGIVILSSGLLHRVGPYRLHVDLARSLAAQGYLVLRLDQSGRGDSTLGRGMSARETIQQELNTVSEYFRETRGIEKLVLIGLCSGADDALALVSTNDNIQGVVLLDGFSARTARFYFRYYAKRIFDLPRLLAAIIRRVSLVRDWFVGSNFQTVADEVDLGGFRNFLKLDQARTAFTKLLNRGGRALCVYTGSVEGYYCYLGQLRDCLKIKNTGDRIQEVFFESAEHVYPIQAHRDRLITTITNWIVDTDSVSVHN